MMEQLDIDALVRELNQAHQVATELLAELERLQTLSQAQVAFDKALGQEIGIKQELDRQVSRLQSEKMHLLNPSRTRFQSTTTGSGLRGIEHNLRHQLELPEIQAAPIRHVNEAERLARRQFEVIRRFKLRLGAEDNLELINRILSDPDQPRGAVLFLIDWSAYMQPLPPEEKDQERYISRLRASISALLEYQEHLQGKIDRLHMQYGGLMDVWKVWCTRESNPTDWDHKVEETRAALRDAIVRLQQKKTHLEEEIATLRV